MLIALLFVRYGKMDLGSTDGHSYSVLDLCFLNFVRHQHIVNCVGIGIVVSGSTL